MVSTFFTIVMMVMPSAVVAYLHMLEQIGRLPGDAGAKPDDPSPPADSIAPERRPG